MLEGRTPRADARARIAHRAVPLTSGVEPKAEVCASWSMSAASGVATTVMSSPSIRAADAAATTSASTDAKTISPLAKKVGSALNGRLYHRVLVVLHDRGLDSAIDEFGCWQ